MERHWVIMTNDYPEAIFTGSEDQVDAFIIAKNRDDKERTKNGGSRIYWKAYPFDVRPCPVA